MQMHAVASVQSKSVFSTHQKAQSKGSKVAQLQPQPIFQQQTNNVVPAPAIHIDWFWAEELPLILRCPNAFAATAKQNLAYFPNYINGKMRVRIYPPNAP